MKKIVGRKKRYSRKRAKHRYSNMKIVTGKTTTLRMLYVLVVLNSVICPQILYDIVLYARHFLLTFWGITLSNNCDCLRENILQHLSIKWLKTNG